MAEIQWIKIVVDMFDNRKMKQIEVLPEGDAIIVIWLKLLCLAGMINENGYVFFTKQMPYSDEMLATQFNKPINTIRLALSTFENFGMIENDNGFIRINNWEKYQNVIEMDRIREQTKKRVQKYRENKKVALLEEKKDCNVTVTLRNATEKKREEKNREDKNRKEEEKKEQVDNQLTTNGQPKINYQLIADLYNETCVSFPKVTTLSEARKKAIKARLNTYTVEDFKKLFEMAEASNFLKGGNARNWTANFDWLLKDANMAKVLDGNYCNKVGATGVKVTQEKDKSLDEIF